MLIFPTNPAAARAPIQAPRSTVSPRRKDAASAQKTPAEAAKRRLSLFTPPETNPNIG